MLTVQELKVLLIESGYSPSQVEILADDTKLPLALHRHARQTILARATVFNENSINVRVISDSLSCLIHGTETDLRKAFSALTANKLSNDCITRNLMEFARNCSKIPRLLETYNKYGISKAAQEETLLDYIKPNSANLEDMLKVLHDNKIRKSVAEKLLSRLSHCNVNGIERFLLVLQDVPAPVKGECLTAIINTRGTTPEKVRAVLTLRKIKDVDKIIQNIEGITIRDQYQKAQTVRQSYYDSLATLFQSYGLQPMKVSHSFGLVEGILSKMHKQNIKSEHIQKAFWTLTVCDIDQLILILDELKPHTDLNFLGQVLGKLTKYTHEGIVQMLEKLDNLSLSDEAKKACFEALLKGWAPDKRPFELMLRKFYNYESSNYIRKQLATINLRAKDTPTEIIRKYGVSDDALKTHFSKKAAKRIAGVRDILTKYGYKVGSSKYPIILFESNPSDLEMTLRVLADIPLKGQMHTIMGELAHNLLPKKQFLLKNSVSPENLAKNLTFLGKNMQDIEAVFDDSYRDTNNATHYYNARTYLKLTGGYNRLYTKPEIDSFCAQKKLSFREFLGEIMLTAKTESKGSIITAIEKAFESNPQKTLWVGSYFPVPMEYFENNLKSFENLWKCAGAGYYKDRSLHDWGFDIVAVQDVARDVLQQTCGGILHNFLDCESNILCGAIVNRVKFGLHRVDIPKITSLTRTLTHKDVDKTVQIDIPVEFAYEFDAPPPVDFSVALPSNNDFTRKVLEYMTQQAHSGVIATPKDIAEGLGADVKTVGAALRAIRAGAVDRGVVKRTNKGKFIIGERK